MHVPEDLHKTLRLDRFPNRTVARVTDFAPPDEICVPRSHHLDGWSGQMSRVRQPEWHRESQGLSLLGERPVNKAGRPSIMHRQFWRLWTKTSSWPFNRPLYGLKGFSATIATDINDLPTASAHGRDFADSPKIWGPTSNAEATRAQQWHMALASFNAYPKSNFKNRDGLTISTPRWDLRFRRALSPLTT